MIAVGAVALLDEAHEDGSRPKDEDEYDHDCYGPARDASVNLACLYLKNTTLIVGLLYFSRLQIIFRGQCEKERALRGQTKRQIK